MYLPDLGEARYVTVLSRHEKFKKRRIFKGEFWFYARYSYLVIYSGLKFLFTFNPQKAVALQSLRVMRICEKQGVHLTFEGLDNFSHENGPYVFACNHMSTFEVNALPGLVSSRTPMTFVVKESLLKTPFFGQILKRLNAIPVKRRSPGEDLMQVLKEGSRLLSKGISVILFPESTRQDVFDFKKFNTLAIKLALKADVPVIPVAIKSDFWGVGKKIKNYGVLHPEKPCFIAFGEPIKPEGRGKTEHQAVLNYIADKLDSWGAKVNRGDA